MNEVAKICRLCLNIIENGVPYSPLTNNNEILQNLNLISSVTIKNLQLTEDPVICDFCDTKLKELAGFKENIITNEFQIQCNQIEGSNFFLEALSEDVEKICRLCLRISEDPVELQKSWKDRRKIFIKCNIHLNLNIPEPSKICDKCEKRLETMWDFILGCSDNEKHITDQVSKKGTLSVKDLLNISLNKVKKEDTEVDNNNVLQKEETSVEESSSKNDAGGLVLDTEATDGDKITDQSVQDAETTSEKGNNEKNSVIEEISDKVESELTNLYQNMTDQDPQKANDTKPAEEESLVFNRTPKTYTRRKPKVPLKTQVVASTSKLNILSNICVNKKSKPSTSKLSDNETIMDQIQNELSRTTSIDALPVGNVADITLEMSLDLDSTRLAAVEIDNNNVTQELIELLEGTEELAKDVKDYGAHTTKQYKNTEELLRVLEDDTDDNIPQAGEDVGRVESLETGKNKDIVKNGPVVENSNELSKGNNFSVVNNTKHVKNIKVLNTLVVKKPSPKKKGKTTSKSISKINVKTDRSSGVQTPRKGHNLRQKTIVMSFREMLNMKPLKKKVPESTEQPAEDVLEKTSVIEKVQVQEKIEEKPPAQIRVYGKKGPVKNARKNDVERQEKEVSHRQPKKTSKPIAATTNDLQGVKEPSVNASEESPNSETVSQIQEVRFEKIQMQEISLVDEKTGEEPQTQAKRSVKTRPVKRAGKRQIEGPAKDVSSEHDGNEAVKNKLQEADIKAPRRVPAVQEIVDVKKKQGKRKTVVESQTDMVPKKRAKKAPQKKVPKNSADLKTVEQANKKVIQAPPAKKDHTQASKEAPATEPEHAAPNEDVMPQNSEEIDSEEDDDDDPEPAAQSSDKPVVVTIIRRKKTKNRAQRDKTWSELTGKPVDEQDVLQVEDVPKKRRGRPPLPDTLRKPKKPKPMYFLCNSCPFKSISEHMILQHQYIHNVVDEMIQFKCSQCGFRTPSEEGLEQHKATHLTLDVIYKCMFCEFGHKKKNSTMYHTLRHEDKDVGNMFYCLVLNQITDEEQYECFQCEYQNLEEAHMPDHVMDHQVETIKNPIVAKFSCKHCMYKTKFEHLLKRHLERHQQNKKAVKAIKKEVKKEPDEDAAQTEEEQSQDKNEGDRVTVYTCEVCGYLTYNRRSLANHKGLKHTRYAPPNPEGDTRRKKREPLPGEIYRCHECDYTTQKKAHLARHVIIHKSKKNLEYYECTHCIFETKHRRSYKRHMEVKHKVIV